jgi:nicotinate phosphoribosyltransferase
MEPPAKRLDPEVFRLPVKRIRSGWYSDAYFNQTKRLLELEDRHPEVTMQVFQRHDSLLGGIDEALAVLRLCSGPRSRRWRLGIRLGAAQRQRAEGGGRDSAA